MVQLFNIATNISTQQLIANRTSRTLNIHLDDIIAEESEEFATRVISNAFRYRRIFAEIAEKIMPEPTVSVVDEDVMIFCMRKGADRIMEMQLERVLLMKLQLPFLQNFAVVSKS